MSSVIQKMLQSIFGNPEFRILFVGLDASGRTTLLYKLKLGEVVTTIPTIGFNVETIAVDGVDLTIWDIGGCDKIRPLWRHYFQNTQGVVFFVDSNDRDRIQEAASEIQTLQQEEELKNAHFSVFATKQDLPNAMSPEEIGTFFQARPVWPICSITGEGVDIAMQAFVADVKASVRNCPPPPPPKGPDEDQGPSSAAAGAQQESKEEALLTEWLEREDEPDEEFLEKLANCTLDSWDHRTHLRIAWLYLTKFGRREGMPKIFESIKHFIENSPRTKRSRGTTFHETMTYFWVHMVHYSIETTQNPTGDFKGFLLMAPQLSNGGMFLAFYTKRHMLNNPEARTTVVLPDKRPLPSIISDIETLKEKAQNASVDQAGEEVKIEDETEDPLQFLRRFEEGSLRSWSHEYLIQIIALYLLRDGRQAGVNTILSQLQRHEKDDFHMTINYFWIQMVTYGLELEGIPVLRDRRVETSSAGEEQTQSISPASEQTSQGGTRQVTKLEDIKYNNPDDEDCCKEEEVPSSDDITPGLKMFLGKLKESTFYATDLLNSNAWSDFYSDSELFGEDSNAKISMVLPDKKSFPSSVSKLGKKKKEGLFSKFSLKK